LHFQLKESKFFLVGNLESWLLLPTIELPFVFCDSRSFAGGGIEVVLVDASGEIDGTVIVANYLPQTSIRKAKGY